MSAASTVLRNIRDAEALAARVRYASAAKTQEAVASWHERASKGSGEGAKESAKADAVFREDLSSANDAVVLVRRERLRALYAADKAQYQRELRARGLAMETAE